MTITNQKIQVSVEATVEGAVKGMDRVADATDDAKKATEKLDGAMKKIALDYQVQQARAENAAIALAKYAAAEEKAAKAQKIRSRIMETNSADMAAAGGAIRGVAQAAKALGPAVAVGAVAIGGAALAAKAYGEESLKVTNIFKNLPFSLKAARNATRGLADDMTLARNAIMANQAGIATTAGSYADLVGMAQTLALKMGRDVNDTVERVTMGIAKQEREILDELVILPRMEDMWKKYAKQLGVTTAELTDHQKNAAFTESALEAMRKATKGVEVDMDGAAGAIARTTVAAQNLKAALLGAEEKTLTLEQGLAQIVLTTNLQGKAIRTTGDGQRELTSLLRDAGVASDELKISQSELADAFERARTRERSKIKGMLADGEVTDDLIAKAQALLAVDFELSTADRRIIEGKIERKEAADEAAVAEAAAHETRLKELEEELAFAQGAGVEEKILVSMLAEEAELRAVIAESMGDAAEAAKIRRKAELDALKAMGAEGKVKKTGGRRRSDAGDRERMRREAEAANALSQHFYELQTARFEKARQESEARNPFIRGELAEQQLAEVVDFEERKAQLVLAARLRSLEEQRAMGVDPQTLIEQEAQAQVEALDAQAAAIQRRYQREIDLATLQGQEFEAEQLRKSREMDLAEIADQAEAQRHAVAIARIEERQRKEQEAHERRMRIAEESVDLALSGAQAIVQGAVIEGRALKSVVAATAKSEAMRHGLILGPSALVQAAFHGLTGNIPLATALALQSAKHFAFAAGMGVLGASVGAFGGQGGVGGRGIVMPGPMETGDRGRDSSGRSGDMGGQIPISETTRRNVSGMAMGSMPSGGVQVVVNMPGLMVGGRPDEKTAQDMETAAMRAGHKIGRLVAGGGNR